MFRIYKRILSARVGRMEGMTHLDDVIDEVGGDFVLLDLLLVVPSLLLHDASLVL